MKGGHAVVRAASRAAEEALMRDDEDIAERAEQEHAAEFAARKAGVDAAIGAGEE